MDVIKLFIKKEEYTSFIKTCTIAHCTIAHCMSDCNSQGQREASQYELMCCDPVNLGRYIQFQENH